MTDGHDDVLALGQYVQQLSQNIADEKEAKKRGNRILKWGTSALVLVVAGLCLGYLLLRGTVSDAKDISADTNRIVRSDLADVQEDAYKLQWVLTQQAVPAVKQMCGQIKSLGGECPSVVLDPEQAPPQAEP